MNNKARETLCEIIRDYGREVAREPKKCKALLLDLCSEHRREINILVSAMDERIANDLLTPQPNIPHAIWLPQLAKRLYDNTGIATEFAQWAVESWALALGVIQEHDLAGVKKEREKQEREREERERKEREERERREQERRQREKPRYDTLPPEMVKVEGGTFVIGNPKGQEEHSDEINSKPVTVATFEIGRYPITNAQYKLFMDDGGYDARKPWWDAAGRAWLEKSKFKKPREWNSEQFGKTKPNHPVVGVTWYEAVAYCRWLTQKLKDGYIYRLPTEAEWEYAARRNTGRTYPWGNEEPDGERANYGGNHGWTTAVGAFPKGATPDGIYDMAGNVWEWTGSVYKPYPYDPRDGRENLSNPASSRFVLRGGGWHLRSAYLRASHRDYASPDYLNYDLGFRLARHLP